MLKPFDNRVVNNSIAWNDFNRNWIQLVLPGDGFRSTSNGNAFKAERDGGPMNREPLEIVQ